MQRKQHKLDEFDPIIPADRLADHFYYHQDPNISMELKTYGDFKRQLDKITARAALTTDIYSSLPKKVSDTDSNDNYNDIGNSKCNSRSSRSSNHKRSILFGERNSAGDSSNIISNSISSSNNSSRKRMKTSDRLSPLSLPRNHADNNINANNCNNSVISSSNSSINTNTSNNGDSANQGINNGVPFATSTWWKKGNEHMRELMSTSQNSTSDLPLSANNSCDNSCASSSGNGNNNNDNNIKNNSNEIATTTSTVTPSSFFSTLATNTNSNSPEPRIKFSQARGTANSRTTTAFAPVLSSATSSGDQKSSSFLQLLGEVASSGESYHSSVHHPQHQLLQHQELQAIRMQENGRTTSSSNNNPQEYNRNPFVADTTPVRYPTSLNKNPIPRMTVQSQSILRPGLILDPFIFPSEGMHMSLLQLQQQQQQQQHYLLQQQSLYPFALPHASMPLYSAQNSFLQERQNQAQRQQVQQPEGARAEMKIDAIRTSRDIGDASPLPALERELEESYQQDASFDEEDSSGRNGNEEHKINGNNNDGNKRKGSIEIIDDNDLVFSDIVPMIPTSGPQSLKVEGFDAHCENVDDVDEDVDINAIVSGNSNIDGKLAHRHSSRSTSSPKNQSKSSPYPNPNSRVKDVKFRAYQAENWTEKFEELLKFREENGHCLVPNSHPENPALAQWTKRQRYQHKLKHDGKRSTITDERVRALDEAGFVWDSHKAVWSERLEELKAFKKEHRHCNVPSRYKPNHQLAIWVKRQRRQWKNKLDHLPNCMTDDRLLALEVIGFVWDMKKGFKSPNYSIKPKRVIKK